jgi:hypothetical protein
MITIENYEAFAIDYIEGELSLAEMAEMEVLLAQHPALRAEFVALAENWADLTLQADDSIVFSNPETLLKPLAAAQPIVAPIGGGMQVRKYFRIAAVAIGMLIGIGGLYQLVPTLTNGLAQSETTLKNQGKTQENSPVNTIINTTKNTPLAEAKTEKTSTTTTGSSEKVSDLNAGKSIENAEGKNPAFANKPNNPIKKPSEKTLILITNPLKTEPKNNNNLAYSPSKNTIKTPESATNNIDFRTQNGVQNANQQNTNSQNVNSQNVNPQNVNQQNAVAIAEPQLRPAFEPIPLLPTTHIQDFYFETETDAANKNAFPMRRFLENSEYLVQTQNLKKRRKPLEAFIPEGSTKSERDGSIWQAFLPENAKDSNLASIADALRPSR